MLTLFFTAKPFRDEAGQRQRNAIRSWTMLRPRPQILLFGEASATRFLDCPWSPPLSLVPGRSRPGEVWSRRQHFCRVGSGGPNAGRLTSAEKLYG